MSKPAYQKNRYLRLDGSPVEQGVIRRSFAPRGLSLCFLVSVGCTTDLNKLEDVGQLIPAVIFTGAGVLQRRFLNLGVNVTWEMDFYRYTIDTQPSPRTQHNPPNNYDLRSIFTTALTSLSGVGCLLYPGHSTGDKFLGNLIDSWHLDIPVQFPTFHLAYQQGLAYHHVKTGKWKIVKMTDMEPETDAKTSPTKLILAPSSTPI